MANDVWFVSSLHAAPRPHANLLSLGEVVYFRIFQRKFVVINTLEAAIELFEKRSNLYSTKPRMVGVLFLLLLKLTKSAKVL